MNKSEFFYGVLILGSLIFVFVAIIYGLKHIQSKVQNAGKLKLKENLFIDTKRRIAVVEYHEKEFLIVFGLQHEHIITLGERRVDDTKHTQKAA